MRNAAKSIDVAEARMAQGVSGADILRTGDAARAKKLRDLLMKKAADARHDIVKFFEFVMKDEKRNSVKVPPHQRVFLDFVMAHERSANMLPIGHAKTYSLAGLTLFFMGQDPLSRGAIVSATQDQAEKVVRFVRDYIDESPELRLVFPHLVRSRRRGDPWTQTKLVIDRPPGIRDPTLVAIGIDGAISGARLNWIIVDDLLNPENTNTKEGRDKVYNWLDLTVLARLDPRGARVVVTNTPYHPDDAINMLSKTGWATLRMDVEGGVFIQDDVDRIALGLPPWDHDLIEPANDNPLDPMCRLNAYKELPPRERTLWPARMDRKKVEQERLAKLPHNFNRVYMCICRDDGTARCKREYIELCKRTARERGVTRCLHRLPEAWKDYPVFTGIDLAMGKGQVHDCSAFFTFVVLPDSRRQILDIDIGQFTGPEIIEKTIAKYDAYGGVVRIENVGGQDFIVQFVQERGVPVYPHKTTAEGKADPTFGVESLFVEMRLGLWLIPNDEYGRMEKPVAQFVESCLNYQPDKHVADELMASHFARAQAFEFGALTPEGVLEAAGEAASGIAASVFSR